jgi:hypothetical protein
MSSETSATRSAFLPVSLLALSVVGWSGFQLTQLVIERSNLDATIAGQEPQIEQSKKVRAALDSLAARTARLARDGNANATLIVEELRKRGVTINPDGPPAQPAP